MMLLGWSHVSLITLGLVAVFTGFLPSGFKIALLIGVHNTVTRQTAVAALAIFITGGMILGSLIAIGVGFYLNYTLKASPIVLETINIDSYQMICLFGALLCLVSAMLVAKERIADETTLISIFLMLFKSKTCWLFMDSRLLWSAPAKRRGRIEPRRRRVPVRLPRIWALRFLHAPRRRHFPQLLHREQRSYSCFESADFHR